MGEQHQERERRRQREEGKYNVEYKKAGREEERMGRIICYFAVVPSLFKNQEPEKGQTWKLLKIERKKGTKRRSSNRHRERERLQKKDLPHV